MARFKWQEAETTRMGEFANCFHHVLVRTLVYSHTVHKYVNVA